MDWNKQTVKGLLLVVCGGAAFYALLQHLGAVALALRWLLRGMSPSVLAMDELYGAEECIAVKEAAACGVPVVATMHAGGIEEVFCRACMRELLESHVFMHVIIVAEHEIRRVISKEEILCCGR